ncbi:hypothetical protein M5689_023499 [Euphorbia peplus]|nr:hypothetical protein M5689_023499 [Euphorbia peplus]
MAGSAFLSDENVESPNSIDRAVSDLQHKNGIDEHAPINDVKSPSVFNRAKGEIEALIQTHKKSDHNHHHQRETHGRRDDIDENTPIDEIKGPSIFQRAKEEVEALFGTIHNPKKEKESSNSDSSSGGFGGAVGRGLEKVCSGEIGASIGRGLEKVCSPSKGSKPD